MGVLAPPVLLAACGGDPTMLRKMCRSLQSRVPEHLAAIRDALHDQDALRLREAAHKFCGMLSAFSTVAGDQAADLEDLAAHGLLKETLPVVEQLAKCATELARLPGGLPTATLRTQTEPPGGRHRGRRSARPRPPAGPLVAGLRGRPQAAHHLRNRLVRQARRGGGAAFRPLAAAGGEDGPQGERLAEHADRARRPGLPPLR